MLRNVKIGTRLGAAFAFAALLTAALGATAFVKVTAITGEWGSFESRTMAKLKLANHAQAALGKRRLETCEEVREQCNVQTLLPG